MPFSNLWFDRWQEVWFVQPEFVEIITWNDFGESHYIGPLRDNSMTAFVTGKTPFNYATNMPHDGWRQFLPYVIDMYKFGTATITQEGLNAWYRLTPKSAGCQNGGTTGNTASQLQIEFNPADIVEDKIFYTALLASSQSVTVTVGGVDLGATWTSTPDGGVGLYHGSVAYGGATGQVVVSVGSSLVMRGESITTSCNRAADQNGVMNWNAWVGSATGASVHASPALPMEDQGCIKGTGAPAYQGLCEFSCHLNYCPIGACTCLAMGANVTRPTETGINGFPAAGLDSTYSGLCAFACQYGYCPPQACDTVEHDLTTPTVSPFSAPACIAGTGEGNL